MMTSPPQARAAINTMKALWITSHSDTLNSIRPEAETLIGLANAGVTCEIMTQGDSAYRQCMEAAGIRVIDYVPRRKFSSAAVRAIRRALTEGGHDILHLFNNKAIANGVRAARGLPVKVVTYRGQTGNVHRYDPICWLTHLSPRIDRVVCVADSVRRDLAKRRLDPDSCVTIYKGHDLAWYTEQPADLRSEFGIPEQDFVICSVANYRARKGLEILVEAMRHLPGDASVQLLLIGSGLTAAKLQRAILASPFRDRIHLAGFRRDACRLVAACDCSILPSIRREGLPKTVIEAMAYGVPPVVTDTGGSAELVIDGDCGLVVPPADPVALARAIRRLYENRAEARRMGDRARQRIDEHFNVRQTIEKTLAMYRNLLQY
jgi:glycosyltransferase involved in cell wall biosynthesis